MNPPGSDYKTPFTYRALENLIMPKKRSGENLLKLNKI
jgi:hypothetical protein